MIQYIKMNPQRLATKRLMPSYFRVQRDIVLAGHSYDGVGNIALLHAERYSTVHVRRTMVEDAEHGNALPLRTYMNSCLAAAREGAVMVSPFISPQEKDILAVLLKEQRPVIYLADNGFGDYYKPSALLFDAVAAGRLLILSPWQYTPRKDASPALNASPSTQPCLFYSLISLNFVHFSGIICQLSQYPFLPKQSLPLWLRIAFGFLIKERIAINLYIARFIQSFKIKK